MAQRYGAGNDRPRGRSGYPWTDERSAELTRRDPYRDPDGWDEQSSGGWYAEPAHHTTGEYAPGEYTTGEYTDPHPSGGAVVARAPTAPRGGLRADFGAHLETHYPRLVAQLYAITLHPGDAHEAVQDAYSRAWRRWAALREDCGDQELVGWVRRVAVRTSMRGWRPGLTRAGLRRNRLPSADALEPQTAALLTALAGLPVVVRRAIVLRHMAGLEVGEIAELERVRPSVVTERLHRGRDAVQDGLDEMAGRLVEAVYAAGGVAGDTGGDRSGPDRDRSAGRHGVRGEQG